MGHSEKRKKRKRKDLDLKNEKRRTTHWMFSRRGPLILTWLFSLGDPAIKRISPYIIRGQTAADLGCGWGNFSFTLAEMLGSEGKVIAVDLCQKCIENIQSKAHTRGNYNIETYNTSAASLPFIEDQSVDFVFANGLLCSMAIERQSAVAEIKRILKPSGHAYLSLGMWPPFGYVSKAEWVSILKGFKVELGGGKNKKWALVTLKPTQ